MDIFAFCSSFLLAGLFGIAGVSKLSDPARFRQALHDFGAPSTFIAPLGLLLPSAEIVVAALLVLPATARYGAVGALLLLALFTAAVGLSLVQGRTPDCQCFGQLTVKPVSRWTIMRNLGLAALAGLVAWHGPSPGALVELASTLTLLEIAALLFGVAVLVGLFVEGWLIQQLMRQNGRLLLRIEALEGQPSRTAPNHVAAASAGLPIGTLAPDFRLARLGGGTRTLTELRQAGKPILLLFSDPGCGPCQALLPEVARWQREHASVLSVALISRGDEHLNQVKTGEHGLADVLLQRDRELTQAYRVHGTPGAVVVQPDGKIGSRAVGGAGAIRRLLATTVRNLSSPGQASLQPGDSAPELRLTDLDGKLVNLAGWRGRDLLLLFWDPGCGFCLKMLGDLRALEAAPTPGAPQVLMIATGGAEANRTLGLGCPVLLDESFVARRTFGVAGTPSAVLIDAEGRIASTVAAGAGAVLALATGSGLKKGEAAPPTLVRSYAYGG